MEYLFWWEFWDFLLKRQAGKHVLSNLNAKQTGLVLVLVPIAIELIFVAIIARELIDAGKEFQRVHHVKKTLADLPQNAGQLRPNFLCPFRQGQIQRTKSGAKN